MALRHAALYCERSTSATDCGGGSTSSGKPLGMEQSRTDSCVFRMVADGKVELIMAVHVDDIVIAGSDEACRDFHAALNTKFPTNNLLELFWYPGCDFKRNWELGTLEIT